MDEFQTPPPKIVPPSAVPNAVLIQARAELRAAGKPVTFERVQAKVREHQHAAESKWARAYARSFM